MAGANELAGHVRWMAKEVHRAYHHAEAALWTECERATCRETCKILEMPVTMPGVAVQDRFPDKDYQGSSIHPNLRRQDKKISTKPIGRRDTAVRWLMDWRCRDCGGEVYRTSVRGRPPVRCEKCRGVKV